MKTFIADIIPKIQRYSQKLDNLTLLTNQHWVVVDEIANSKNVYIFRSNNELLISQNGKVEKARWEYLGNHALLIDRKDESYLFKHGFFDEIVLALKVDGKEEYAILVNETKFGREISSYSQVIGLLEKKYLTIQEPMPLPIDKILRNYSSNKGNLDIYISEINDSPWINDVVLMNGQAAPNGKYKIGFMNYLHVENGVIISITNI